MLRKYTLTLLTAMLVLAGCGETPTAARRADSATLRKDGLPTATISGPSTVTQWGWQTYSATNVSGGTGNYSYVWQYRPNNDTNWYELGTTQSVDQWFDEGDTTMQLMLIVYSGGFSGTNSGPIYKTVTIDID